MIVLKISPEAIPEKAYIAEVFFGEFLGLDYKIEVVAGEYDYRIILPNSKEIVFENSFFRNHPNGAKDCLPSDIPQKVCLLCNDFTGNEDIVSIYGSDKFIVDGNKILSGFDIFASAFFMLSRWEENINKIRDKHERFPASASLAYKCGFLDRPVVNEYVNFLWRICHFLAPQLRRKQKKTEVIITHDVDHIIRWKSIRQLFRVVFGDLILRKNLRLGCERILDYFDIKSDRKNDPYDLFDWLMSLSERNGAKSRFYIMSGGNTDYDNNYSLSEPKLKDIVDRIRARNHIIGIHPSYDSFNNQRLFSIEKEKLEEYLKAPVLEGRQHYLRFEVPTTWQLWDDNGMGCDSTCGYPEIEGFRCGTGDEFHVFNFVSRKKLRLRERPLLIMDASLFNGTENNLNKVWAKVVNIKNKCLDSNATVLWHNSYIDNIEIYERMIKLFNGNR